MGEVGRLEDMDRRIRVLEADTRRELMRLQELMGERLSILEEQVDIILQFLGGLEAMRRQVEGRKRDDRHGL